MPFWRLGGERETLSIPGRNQIGAGSVSKMGSDRWLKIALYQWVRLRYRLHLGEGSPARERFAAVFRRLPALCVGHDYADAP